MFKRSSSFLLLAILAFQSVASEQESPRTPFFSVSDGREQSAPVINDSTFYGDKEKGWFWYEEPVDPPIDMDVPFQSEPPPPKETKVEPPKPPEDKPLSAAWFRKNMEKYRDKAVDEPTPENVSAYMYLQRVMLDKAEQFGKVTQQVVMSDAVLDENSRRPLANFGGQAMDEMAIRGTEKVAKKLADVAGFWFFYASTCEFCVKEAGVLKGLMNAYGFKVLPVALDGLPLPNGDFPDFTIDRGQAKKLGVETTPALFLVKPGADGGAIQIGQGLLAGDEIIKRAVDLAHQNNWLNNNEYNSTLKVKPMQIDTQTIQNVDDVVVDTPSLLVKTIRDNLRKQF